ncbi:MAG: type III pantothenate kinase [Flavobacteriales bacterium]|nr:type III pantothenate kinase [Flavobacteriales bacterium]
MNLVIDIGNSNIKTAQFNGSQLIKVNICSVDSFELNESFEKVLVSSVSNKKTTEQICSKLTEPIIFNNETPIPLKNLYHTPETLGKDRLANAVAACRLWPNTNTLVIDAGTCLKFDFVTNSNEYLGGSISLGLEMRFKALNTFTANLPLVHFDEMEEMMIGNSTATSIFSGCWIGMNNEIETTIIRYREKFKNLNVVITGGNLEQLQKMDFSQKNSIFADRWLTLKGLNEILKYNA